jgi:hypothetical protein
MTDRFQLLPTDAQKALQEFEYDKALKEVHAKYKLHIDQAATLEKIVADVIFGDERSQHMIQLIQNDLRLPVETATTIAFDVNDKILTPIQKIMQRIQDEESV